MFTLPTEEHKCTGDIVYIAYSDILCLHCLQRNISAQVIYYVYIAYRGT